MRTDNALKNRRVVAGRKSLRRSAPLQRSVRDGYETRVEAAVGRARRADAVGLDDAVVAAEELEGENVAVRVGGDDGVCA